MCGQSLPEKTHFGLQLSPSQQTLIEAIQSAGNGGASRERLAVACKSTPNALSILLSKLNRKLRTVGHEIIRDAYSPMRYKIVECQPKD